MGLQVLVWLGELNMLGIAACRGHTRICHRGMEETQRAAQTLTAKTNEAEPFLRAVLPGCELL